MKITLAFTIYNKENWVESILKSWIENASNKLSLEIIIVFDDLKDNSKIISEKYLQESGLNFKFLFADDKHEIFCNNLALEHATGDYIIFIQDDNWIYDKGWDEILNRTIQKTKHIGAIAFLAGSKIISYSKVNQILRIIKRWIKHLIINNNSFYPKFGLQRLESNRKHKGINFYQLKIPSLPIGIWEVNVITRPFCISRELLLSYGGLNKVFMPHTGDDLDLSLKLLRDGYKNLYVSFDIVNISTIGDNQIHGTNRGNLIKAYKLNYKYHKPIINNPQKHPIKKIHNFDFN